MAEDLTRDAPNVPKEQRALAQLQRHIDLGDLEAVIAGDFRSVPRYLVTYMNSQTAAKIRSATVVSVTNQSGKTNLVSVAYFRGFTGNAFPVGTSTFSIPPDFTIDFGSRRLPNEITVVSSLSAPELVFDQGRAIVSSVFPEIGVSSRVYYTSGDRDQELLAITDSKVVVFGKGNIGD
jgi:hypothetical protein